MSTQGTDLLVVVNDMPSVEKLWNGRFRLEFFCAIQDPNEGWYGDNIAGWLPEFGALQDADFAGTGWSARDGEAYPNMHLVKAEVPYIPPSESHLVALTYETLTDAWVEEKDEDTDYELNGLKSTSRTFVALPDTAYTNVVGTSTIDSDGTTLYLASYKIVETDAMWRLQELWLEAGILRITESTEAEGVKSVTTTFLVNEGSVVGPITDRDTSNYEGLQTIVVTSLQDKDGNSIVEGGENLVNQVSGLSSFTYPGIVDINYISSSTSTDSGDPDNVLNIQAILEKAPAQSKVKTTIYFIFQESNSAVASDYTYAGSAGLWSPNHWASIGMTGIGEFVGDEWNDSATFRGYRTSGSSQSGSIVDSPQVSAILRWQGAPVVVDRDGVDYTATVDQGPPDPIGNTYTLDVQISPAFDDVDGNQYYKKTIVVTDAIPTQPLTASLPYT